MPTQEERLETLDYDLKQFKTETVKAYGEMAVEMTIVKGLTEDAVKRLASLKDQIEHRFGRIDTRLDGIDAHLRSIDGRFERVDTRLDVHQAARIMSAGHGRQVLLSQTTRDLVEHDLPDGVSLRDLGVHRLKDLLHPSHLFQLVIAGFPADFPPLKTLDAHHHLPLQPTSLIGREQEVSEITTLLTQPEARLLTLLGPGGIGKTRLAIAVATSGSAARSSTRPPGSGLRWAIWRPCASGSRQTLITKVGDRAWSAECFWVAALLALSEGEPERAAGLASVDATQGEIRWAAQLWGAAEALRESIDVPRLPVDRAGYEQAVAAARAQLGEEAFATAWQEGRATNLEQVIDEATHR
jgi:hypothetical protein